MLSFAACEQLQAVVRYLNYNSMYILLAITVKLKYCITTVPDTEVNH